MKKLIFTALVAVLFSAVVMAQSVSESSMSMSLGSQTGYTMDIDGADEKITEDVFKKMMKDYGKVKKNKKAKEYYGEAIKLPMVAGSDELNLYVKFDERVDLTTVTAWVDLGGAFVNGDEHPKEAQGMESFMSELYVEVKKAAIEKEMKAAEKELKKMSKGLSKLEDKNKGYHNDIEKAKDKIDQAEKNIEQNLKDQEDARVMIAKQKEAVEEIIGRLNNVGFLVRSEMAALVVVY